MAEEQKPKTMDERLDALTHTVELLASMQIKTEEAVQQTQLAVQETQSELKKLTREVRVFRHFVLAMGANIESRLLKLEDGPDDTPEAGERPAA